MLACEVETITMCFYLIWVILQQLVSKCLINAFGGNSHINDLGIQPGEFTYRCVATKKRIVNTKFA